MAHEGHRKAAEGQGFRKERLLEKKKMVHVLGPSKNKPSLLLPCHNAKCLAPGVSLPSKIMLGAATTLHGDALSMPPVSMVTTRNVARVTRRQMSWDLILKMRFWGCWVYFSPHHPSSFSSIFGVSLSVSAFLEGFSCRAHGSGSSSFIQGPSPPLPVL